MSGGPRPGLPSGFLDRPIAHRGLWGPAAPENSLAAIEAAAAAGYAVEIDVRLTADGAALVFHDDDLARMCGIDGRVAERSLAETRALRLAGGSEPIPTLGAALAVAGDTPVLIELKTSGGAPPDRLAPAVASAIGAGPRAVMSFDRRCVEQLATAAPATPRGVVAADPGGLAAAAADAGAAFVSVEQSRLADAEVRAVRATGRAVVAWTVRSPAEAAAAQCDQITFEGFRP